MTTRLFLGQPIDLRVDEVFEAVEARHGEQYKRKLQAAVALSSMCRMVAAMMAADGAPQDEAEQVMDTLAMSLSVLATGAGLEVGDIKAATIASAGDAEDISAKLNERFGGGQSC